MANAKAESQEPIWRPTFDRRIKLEFHGARISSDGGLLAYRELDEVRAAHDVADMGFTVGSVGFVVYQVRIWSAAPIGFSSS